MIKLVPALALAATVVLPTLPHADDTSNKNGSTAKPKSSAAITPAGDKHSAGTVGLFTAPDKDQKDTLEAK